MLLTPSGRFQCGVKICLSISSFHPKNWQPSWSSKDKTINRHFNLNKKITYCLLSWLCMFLYLFSCLFLVRTVLTALVAFFDTPGGGAIGSLDHSSIERKLLADSSGSWKCSLCNLTNDEILPPMTDEQLKQNESLPTPPTPIAGSISIPNSPAPTKLELSSTADQQSTVEPLPLSNSTSSSPQFSSSSFTSSSISSSSSSSSPTTSILPNNSLDLSSNEIQHSLLDSFIDENNNDDDDNQTSLRRRTNQISNNENTTERQQQRENITAETSSAQQSQNHQSLTTTSTTTQSTSASSSTQSKVDSLSFATVAIAMLIFCILMRKLFSAMNKQQNYFSAFTSSQD